MEGGGGALALRISQEGAAGAGESEVEEVSEIARVEFEGSRELLRQLPHALDELEKNRRQLFLTGRVVRLIERCNCAAPQRKLVAEREPLFAHEHADARPRERSPQKTATNPPFQDP